MVTYAAACAFSSYQEAETLKQLTSRNMKGAVAARFDAMQDIAAYSVITETGGPYRMNQDADRVMLSAWLVCG